MQQEVQRGMESTHFHLAQQPPLFLELPRVQKGIRLRPRLLLQLG